MNSSSGHGDNSMKGNGDTRINGFKAAGLSRAYFNAKSRWAVRPGSAEHAGGPNCFIRKARRMRVGKPGCKVSVRGIMEASCGAQGQIVHDSHSLYNVSIETFQFEHVYQDNEPISLLLFCWIS